MSMIAHFVRVSPDQLAGLLRHPSTIEGLFDLQPAPMAGRDEFIQRGPQMPEGVLMARAVPSSGATVRAKGQGAALSIDKSWHGIHYLLCGAVEPTSTLVSKTIMGGTEVGDDFSGYGPARYFAVKETAAISAELNRGNLEAEMTRRFDPAQMTKLGIYPNGWSGPDAQWLLREFRNLRAFYADASAKGFAMVTCLV